MPELSTMILGELQSINAFLVNSVSALQVEAEDQTNALKSILDFLKDTDKQKAAKEKTDTMKASKTAATGTTSGVGGENILKGFSLKDISDNIGKLSKGLILFSIASATGAPKKFTEFMKDLFMAMTNEGKTTDAEGIAKMYTAMSAAMLMLGQSVGQFGKGLMVFAIAAKLRATDIFIAFVQKFFSPAVMGKIDPEPARRAGIALQELATGIMKFVGYLALSAILIPIAIPALIVLLPVVMLTMFAFGRVAKNQKVIDRGAKTMAHMSEGLLVFTVALIIMRFVRPVDLLMAVGVVAVFSLFVLAISLVNKLSGGAKGAEHSAKSMVAMGIGLMAITVSIMFMRFVQVADIMKMALTVVVLGIFMYIMGNSKDVKKGAWAMLIIAISIGVLAYTIQMFKPIEWETIGKVGACIGGIALALYVLGTNARNILIASLSLIVASLAIGVLAFVMSYWQDQKISGETMIQVGLAIGGLTIALMLLAVNKIGVIVAAAALIVASVSIIVLGYAVSEWQNAGIQDKTLIQMGLAVGGLTIVLLALGAVGPLVLAGAAALAIVALSFSYSFKLVIEALNVFKKSKWGTTDDKALNAMLVNLPMSITEGFLRGGGPLILLALPALVASGLALAPIAYALSEFKRAGVTEADAMAAGNIVKSMLVSVRKPIEELGKGSGIFTDSDFENGIDAAQGLGRFIYELSLGVKAMATMTFPGEKGKPGVTLTDGEIQMVGTNVSKILTAVKDPIAAIGATNVGIMDKLAGIMSGRMSFNEPNFKNGLEAVQGLGQFMKELAEGTIAMANNTYKGIDGTPVTIKGGEYTKIGENVGAIINAVKIPIIDAGKVTEPFTLDPNDPIGFFMGKAGNFLTTMFGDSDFKNGMDSVGGLGAFLGGLADGAMKLASGQFPNIADPKGPPISLLASLPKIGLNVGRIINALRIPIEDIGKDEGMFLSGSFKKGMDVVGGLGTLLGGIADGAAKLAVGKYPDPEFPADYSDPKHPKKGTFITLDINTIGLIGKRSGWLIRAMVKPIQYAMAMTATMDLSKAQTGMNAMSDVYKSMAEVAMSASAIATNKQMQDKNFSANLTAAFSSVNAATKELFKNATFADDASIIRFDKLVKSIILLSGVDTKLKRVAVAMKDISTSMITTFTSLNTVAVEKLDSLTKLFQGLVEVDKINSEELDKKIQHYERLIEKAKNSNVEATAQLASKSNKTLESLDLKMDMLAASFEEMIELLKVIAQGTTKSAKWTAKLATV